MPEEARVGEAEVGAGPCDASLDGAHVGRDAFVDPDASLEDGGVDAGVLDAGMDARTSLGGACEAGGECGTGFCVDGVCCESACGGLCRSCRGLDTAAADGLCRPVEEDTVPGDECTADVAGCDLGLCDGAGGCAPSPDGTLCRSATGVCDVAESCSGGSCPADRFAGAGTECRSASGVCDRAEVCTGSGRSCPANGFEAATTVCRSAAGACDLEETCSGTGTSCPSDLFAETGTVCRSAAGPCDVAETCAGSTASCPVDAFAGSDSPACIPFACGSGAACETSCVDNDDCARDGRSACVGGLCVEGKAVFVTSMGFPVTAIDGDVRNGDSICQATARAVGRTGRYVAWLSGPVDDVRDRFFPSPAPYVMAREGMANVTVADDWMDALDGTLQAPIRYDEFGRTTPVADTAWTGSDVSGVATGVPETVVAWPTNSSALAV